MNLSNNFNKNTIKTIPLILFLPNLNVKFQFKLVINFFEIYQIHFIGCSQDFSVIFLYFFLQNLFLYTPL